MRSNLLASFPKGCPQRGRLTLPTLIRTFRIQGRSLAIFIGGKCLDKDELDRPNVIAGVEVFSVSLLGHANFQELCKIALHQRQIPRTRVQRNLRRLLRLLAFHLNQEVQASEHLNIIKFVRGASFRIASRILQSPEIVSDSSLEESNVRRLEVANSRSKIEELSQVT